MLGTTDYITIVIYAAFLIGMGLYLSKRASGGLEAYFLGGRKLPWYFLGCSGMATWFDVTGTMVITSFLFMIGPQALYIGFRGDAVLVLVFILCFTGKWHRRSRVMTGAEWMQFRFGTGRDADMARLLQALVSILPVVGTIAVLMKGTGLFLSMFFPYDPDLCAAVLICIAVIYTMMSGFYGVVVSDVIQSLLIFVSAIVLGICAFNMIPSVDFITNIATSLHGTTDWAASLPSWNIEFPQNTDDSGYGSYKTLGLFILFCILTQTIYGSTSGADQKYFASKTDKEVGKLNLLIGFMIAVRWPMMIGLAVLGLFLVNDMFEDKTTIKQASTAVHLYIDKDHLDSNGELEEWKNEWHTVTTNLIAHPDRFDQGLVSELESTLGEDWKKKLPLVGYGGHTDSERILPAVILNYVPAGMLGIVLITALAATMSTFDSTLNSASSYIVRDIYQKWFNPKADAKTLIRFAWLATIVVAIIGYMTGFLFGSINDAWKWVLNSLMCALFVPNFLRLYWWRMNGWGVAFGMTAGGIISIFQTYILPDLSDFQMFAFVSLFALSFTIIGCLLTKPTDMKTLVHFYKKTRPFGVWGPVRKHLKKEQLEYIDAENRRDIISVPFAFVYQIGMFLIPMQVIIHGFDDLYWSLPIFGVACLGMYFIWWKNQRPDRNMEDEGDLLKESG